VRCLVVFHDHGEHCLKALLKPGFRHCFVAVQSDGYWIEIDARDGLPAVKVQCAADYDLAGFYRDNGGFSVIETCQSARPPVGPLSAANCVGMAKAILGLRAPLALTPYQLYRRLSR
jgi:hypothetical protein